MLPEPDDTTNQAAGDVSCWSPSACLALGIYDYKRGFGQFAETWNGSGWTVRKLPNASHIDLDGASCRSVRVCVTVGTIQASAGRYVPVAVRWNGRVWKRTNPPVSAGATGDLRAVACAATECLAIGEFVKGRGAPSLLAERWNGASWRIEPLPRPSAGGGLLSAVACPTTTACSIVGSDNRGLFSEFWNGSSWVVKSVALATGGSFAALNGLACSAVASCEAVGTYQKGGTFHMLAEVWNGSRWLAQAPPTISGATSSQLNAISCISATDCEAAGNAETKAGTEFGILEKWNGTTWSVQNKVLPAGDTSARLEGISCTTGPVCEAVGYHGVSAYRDHVLALRYSS